MGLFDFFRQQPARSPNSDDVEADLDDPRCHHYMFAHAALRMAAFENPLAFLGTLASPDANEFLASLMASVSDHCRERQAQADFRVEDLIVHKVRVGSFPCAVVEMPRPRAITEAFFAAGVVLADLSAGAPPSDVGLRYFTLEKGMHIDGASRTVFCEWTSSGSHLNFGEGPGPALGPFLEAVRELLATSGERQQPDNSAPDL